MPQHNGVFVFEERFDARIFRRKYGVLFKIFVFVRKHQPLPSFAVGQMKFPFGVEQNIFALDHLKFPIRYDVSERAHFCRIFIDARALDIEKNVLHAFFTLISVFPPM